MEGACPGRATPTNWRCGRAARQLSAPHPGHTQTLPSGNHFCARHGGGQSQGLWRLQRPRRGCGRSRWPAPQMRGHFSTELRCRYTCQLNSGETPKKNLCTRDGRGERWGQRTRGMRGCSCAKRACACGPGARAQRRAPSGWGALASREEPPSKFSNGRARCRFKRRGGVIAQELPEQIAKLLVWKPAGSSQVTPTFYII